MWKKNSTTHISENKQILQIKKKILPAKVEKQVQDNRQVLASD